MKKKLFITALVLTNQFSHAQIVNIPDPDFKAILVASWNTIDKNKDKEIQTEEAKSVTYLNVSYYRSIKDLTGIEAFTSLTGLSCSYNLLKSLDISKNTSLVSLECGYNQISSLDLSNNLKLGALVCSGNKLPSINVSKNNFLYYLYCDNNQLTSLDVTKNADLIGLYSGNNQLTSLDLSNNTALRYLELNSNQLSTLDVSHNSNLSAFTCNSNLIKTLDVSNIFNLDTLFCQNNPNLTQICINNSQKNNKISSYSWEKDPSANWNASCGTLTGVNNSSQQSSSSKTLLQIFNILGQAVKLEETHEGHLFIYKYSDETTKKIIRQE